MKIFLYYIGKPKDPHANAIAEDFLARAARYCAMPRCARSGPSAPISWAKHPTARKIFLDPAGKPLDSAGFAALIAKAEMEGRDLVFLIGGARRSAGRMARARGPAAVAFRHDVSARTGPRHAGRADLSARFAQPLRGHPYPRLT